MRSAADRGQLPLSRRSRGVPAGAVYAGPAGFADEQRRAEQQPQPSYLVLAGDPMAGRLESDMQSRGISAERLTFRYLVLFEDLSQPIEPAELGEPARYEGGPLAGALGLEPRIS